MTGQMPPSAKRAGRVLRLDHLSVEFPTEGGIVRAVRDLSFELREGDVLGVVGESGSGKSAAALAIMGLLPRTATVRGSIVYRGRELVGLADKALRPVRGRSIAMIFQDPMTSLNPVFTVGWQLAEAYRTHHDVSRRTAWGKAVDALDRVGIPDPRRRARQYPHEFSGGMRQRVVIAMAVINEPAVIIADEPTTALDVTVQAQILETLLTIRDDTGAALVLITHDLGVAAGMVDRLLVMYAGTAVEAGPVDEVFEAPRMPYTVGLLGANPHPSRLGQRLVPIAGAPPSLVNLPSGCAFAPRCPLAVDPCRETEPELVPAGRSDHLARCRRWADLPAVGDPAALFGRSEHVGEGRP